MRDHFYPLIAALAAAVVSLAIDVISGNDVTAIMQSVVFALSAPLFFSLAADILQSRQSAFATTLAYAVLFGIFGAHHRPLATEGYAAIASIAAAYLFFLADSRFGISKAGKTSLTFFLTLAVVSTYTLSLNDWQTDSMNIVQRLSAGAHYSVIDGSHLPPRLFYILDFFGINIGLVYLTLLIAATMLIFGKMHHRSKMAFITILAAVMTLAGMASTTYDFSRRIYPALPLLLLIVAAIISNATHGSSQHRSVSISKPFWSDKALLSIMLITAAAATAHMIFYGFEFTSFDTPTYVDAFREYAAGHIDQLRTPLYPLLIGLMSSLFGGTNAFLATIIFQNVAFIASIPIFHSLSRYFVKSERIVLSSTAIYSLFNIAYGWNNWIMTESLAVVSLVGIIYLATRMITEAKLKWLYFTASAIILAILLRPIFLFLIPCVFLTGVVLFFRKNDRRAGRRAIVASLLPAAVVIVYALCFRVQHGHFTISFVSAINNFTMLRSYGLLSPEHCPDGKFHEIMERFRNENGQTINPELPPWHEVNQFLLVERCSLTDVKTATDRAIHDNMEAWIAHIPKRATDAFHFNTVMPRRQATDKLLLPLDLFQITIGAVALFLSVFVALWILRKDRHPLGVTFFIVTILAVNIVAAVVGSCDDFDRLIYPSLPIVILLMAMLADGNDKMPIITKT